MESLVIECQTPVDYKKKLKIKSFSNYKIFLNCTIVLLTENYKKKKFESKEFKSVELHALSLDSPDAFNDDSARDQNFVTRAQKQRSYVIRVFSFIH